MNATTTGNVDLCVRAQVELFGAGRLELADALIGPGCIDHGGDTGPIGAGREAAPGPEGVAGVVGWLRSAFPDLEYSIEEAFGSGDRVALRCTARGTHLGDFLGHPATGRRFDVQQIHLFRVQDGRIAEHWACRDDVRMMQQLGLAGPPPAGAAEAR